MTVLLRNLSIPIERDATDLEREAARHLRVGRGRVSVHRIVKCSLDSRRGRPPKWLYTVALDLEPEVEHALLQRKRRLVEEYEAPQFPHVERLGDAGSGSRPVVLGSGPAGLFAAYRLVQAGLRPIVIERGLAVTERTKEWYAFLKGGAFDSESNLLYGEGGAGTYSDGKLYTRVHDIRATEVIEVLLEHGAPAEIAYQAKPHIGSNLLPSIVRRLRNALIERGAEFRFSTRMTDIVVDGPPDARTLRGVVVEPAHPAESPGVGSGPETIETHALFLAPGHSARETLRFLHAAGLHMEPKPFQLGVRVEHSQELVNRIQYREQATHPNLPPAEYRLVAKRRDGDVFSFCMCPGGEILPSTEKPGFICVNGASRFKRIGDYANSGFVLTIDPERYLREDAAGVVDDPLAGIAWQERIESRAAALAEHPFGAPGLRLVDFLEGRVSTDLPASSYPLPLTPAPFEEFLPRFVLEGIRDGLEQIGDRIPLFHTNEALIVGPEARSSCPVRITRDDATRESTSILGVYPVGEGAGFAGGIMSAAIDGMVSVEAHIAHRREVESR